MQPAFSYLGYREGEFSISEEVSQKILSLPMHPYLRDSEVDKIVMEVRTFLRNSNSGKEESMTAVI